MRSRRRDVLRARLSTMKSEENTYVPKAVKSSKRELLTKVLNGEPLLLKRRKGDRVPVLLSHKRYMIAA